MWNTAVINYMGYTGFMNVRVISKNLFDKILTYEVNKNKLSESTAKRINKAKKQSTYENGIYELVKSNAISKKVFGRFLTQTKGLKHNENCYYINYKYYDIIIERLLNFIYIVDKKILQDAHELTVRATFNNAKTVTNIFIPIQKLAINEIEQHKENIRKYSNYITNKLCLLNHRLNELDSRRVIYEIT